jgi:hypothetical protein
VRRGGRGVGVFGEKAWPGAAYDHQRILLDSGSRLRRDPPSRVLVIYNVVK